MSQTCPGLGADSPWAPWGHFSTFFPTPPWLEDSDGDLPVAVSHSAPPAGQAAGPVVSPPVPVGWAEPPRGVPSSQRRVWGVEPLGPLAETYALQILSFPKRTPTNDKGDRGGAVWGPAGRHRGVTVRGAGMAPRLASSRHPGCKVASSGKSPRGPGTWSPAPTARRGDPSLSCLSCRRRLHRVRSPQRPPLNPRFLEHRLFSDTPLSPSLALGPRISRLVTVSRLREAGLKSTEERERRRAAGGARAAGPAAVARAVLGDGLVEPPTSPVPCRHRSSHSSRSHFVPDQPFMMAECAG